MSSPLDPAAGVLDRTAVAPAERTLIDILTDVTARHPEASAIDDGSGALSYRELLARVWQTAARLHASGVRRGDRLAAGYRARLAAEPQDLVIADPGADRMFDDRVYKRGALALQALRGLVGDEAFFDLIRRWTTAYRHAVVTTEEFRALVVAVAGEPAGVLLSSWIDRAALPR